MNKHKAGIRRCRRFVASFRHDGNAEASAHGGHDGDKDDRIKRPHLV